MELELFIILALIIVFLVSCCGLIQKIRENYDENHDDRGRVISVTQIRVPNQAYNNNAYQNGGDDLSSGIFPATLAPPPYAEHLEPPPRYEDLIKESQYTVIQMSPNAGGIPQAVYVNQNEAAAQRTEQQTALPTVTTAH